MNPEDDTPRKGRPVGSFRVTVYPDRYPNPAFRIIRFEMNTKNGEKK
jgi:hypothetical protein